MPQLNVERRAVNDEFNWVVGTNIRHFRLRYNLTLAELAEAAQMDVTQLNRIEMAMRSIKLREAKCIAAHFEMTLEDLCRKQRGVAYTK